MRVVIGARDAALDEVLCVHFGRSANCSSIGSVVDVLFVSGVVGTAVLASVAVLLGGERTAEASTSGDTTRDASGAHDVAADETAARHDSRGDTAP